MVHIPCCATFGKLHLLLNNAGAVKKRNLEEASCQIAYRDDSLWLKYLKNIFLHSPFHEQSKFHYCKTTNKQSSTASL